MSRFGRIIAFLGVGLLAAAGVTGVLAGPGGVLRGSPEGLPTATQSADVVSPDRLLAASALASDDSSHVEVVGDVIACPWGEDTRFEFEQQDGKFEVKGLLVSLDDTTVVVLGPSGEVTAAVEGSTVVKGEPQDREPVKVEGFVSEDGSFLAREVEPACKPQPTPEATPQPTPEPQPQPLLEVVGDVITCASGEDTRFKFEQHDGKFEVKGLLKRLDSEVVVVLGPSGEVEASLAADVKIEGNPQIDEAVEVEGFLLEDGTLVAREIEAECKAQAQQVVGDTLTCPSGKQVQVKFAQHDGKFEVKGLLKRLDSEVVVVLGPSGEVEASLAANVKIEGNPQIDEPVEVEGIVLEDGSFEAWEIEDECGEHHDDDDDGHDHDGDHRDHDDDHDHDDSD